MQCAGTKCLHVCLHIDWNPYGTFKGSLCTQPTDNADELLREFI